MDYMLRSTLKRIAKLLNDQSITWAVGASVMLNYYGIVQNPRDIDVMVDLKDIDKLDSILSEVGVKSVGVPDATYKTKVFYEYMIGDIEVDVMGGLCICSGNKDYLFNFNRDSVGDYMDIDGVEVPLAKLTDWYDIYKVLPNREEKAAAIKEYMEKEDVLIGKAAR